jgi:tetratricopeptide (TPR) repeat protein
MDPCRITDLAEAVADGRPADWRSAEDNARGDDRETIAMLKEVASLGEVFARLSGRASGGAARRTRLATPTTWGGLQVLEHVGWGRFGDVYRAWDPALDREVALKLVAPGEAEAVETQVVEEGRLMARVRHPHVVTIHGAQRIDGVTGLWMEFIEGRTLAAELAEAGSFGAEALVCAGIELCQALAAVHKAGLVHRDIKAQNVLRDTRGRLVLGDFGTGREFDDPDDPPTGLAGTPAYLAPEIFWRQSATPQSDIYSLGALLFHLATGAYPVPGRSLRELRDAHAAGRRIPLRSLRSDLPGRLVEAIERALDPEPSRRFDNAGEMLRALDRSRPGMGRVQRIVAGVVGTGAVVFLLAAAFSGSNWSPGRAAVLPFEARDWILVTAFENRTGEPLLDGTLEYALERELSNSTFVNVVPRARVVDTLRLMLKPLDVRLDATSGREVALRDGHIRALLGGRIDRMGEKYTMRADVTSIGDGRVVASFEEGPASQPELFESVRRLALDIREGLGEALPRTQNAAALPQVTTSSLHALQLYAQAAAMEADDGTWDGRAAAAEKLLREAVREDPGFASAYRKLSIAARGQNRLPEALEHIERAVALSDRSSETERLVAIGELNAVRAEAVAKTDEERVEYFNQAAAAFEAALELQPDNHSAAVCLTNVNRFGLRRPDVRVARQLADRRQNSARLQVAAAAAILWADPRDRRGAWPYVHRAAALPAAGFRGVADVAAARVFEAYDAWLDNRPRDAVALADRLAAELPTMPPDAAAMFAAYLSRVYTTLGALRRAEAMNPFVVQGPDGPVRRTMLTLRIAREREDRDAMRAVLGRAYPDILAQELGGGWVTFGEQIRLLVEAGLLERAREAAATIKLRNPTPVVLLLEGELAVAEGRDETGVALLQQYLAQSTEPENPSWVRAAITLAGVLVHTGDLPRAVEILEAASERRYGLAGPASSHAYAWLAARERLVDVYRSAGRVSEADAVEAELLALLEVADDDHPIKRRLMRSVALRDQPPTERIAQR